MAAERVFHKDGATRYAYRPDQVVNLVAAGWREGEDVTDKVEPKDVPSLDADKQAGETEVDASNS